MGNKEQVPEKVRPKKKIVISKRDQESVQTQEEGLTKEHTETVPREVIQTSEGTLIQNFEVDFGPEEELVMAAGIRGIRALRVQRDAIEQQLSVPETTNENPVDRFQVFSRKLEGGEEEEKKNE